MDRLIKPEVEELNMFFIRGKKCSTTFKMSNLMHTMPVAISLTCSNTSCFSFSQPFCIIPPLSTSSFTISLSRAYDQPPLSTPLDTILVRSSMLPTGKAHQDELLRLFSRPGPHIFKDAKIPISFVGPHVVEFLLLHTPKTLEINFLFSRAVSWCDESQLNSLLRCAVKRGKSWFVSWLIEAGAEINNRDPDGQAVMTLAVKSGNIESVRVLIESGCDVESVDCLLHDAAATDRVDLMEILCLNYVDTDLNALNSQGQTALQVAAIHGNLESIQFLVSVGSDPDFTDRNGLTALHYAASQGHTEAVELLLHHSACAKYALTKEGKTAFALAADNGHSHLYDALYLGDMLHRAARMDDVGTIKSCLARGAKLNGKDQNGWTPLHRAAFKGHLESVKVLVGQGAAFDVVDDAGYTPLLRAVEAGHVQIAMYLLAHGAKANLKSLKGVAPLDLDNFKNSPSFVHLNLLHQHNERT